MTPIDKIRDRLRNDKELIASTKAQATPIDFEKLEATGLLIKKGTWYQVSNLNELPEHVGKQIRDIKNDRNGNLLVKLPTSWKTTQQLYKKLTGKNYFE